MHFSIAQGNNIDEKKKHTYKQQQKERNRRNQCNGGMGDVGRDSILDLAVL